MFYVWLFLPFNIFVGLVSTFQSLSLEAKPKDLKVLVISDLNASYGSTHYSDEVLEVVKKIDSIKPDLILCGGDMVAGQKPSITKQQTIAMWDAFNQHVLAPINKLKIPFGFTIGNHDGSPNFLQDRELASAFWSKNKQATHLNFIDDTHFPYYFSYEQNGVFIMSWDASGSIIKDEVYLWMKEQLAHKVAKKARMRILLGHLPLYAVVDAKNKKGEVNADPEKAMSFFKENNINLYISGHQHAYFPAEKEGVFLLNVGAIGDGPRKLMGSDKLPVKAYSVINIPQKSEKFISIKTINPTTDEAILLKNLPQSIIGFNGISTLGSNWKD